MRIPVLRISLNNATILSAAYLASGIAIEVVRRVWSPRWAERAALAMEAFPARLLDVVGLLPRIRLAYARDQMSTLDVRLIYGLTTVLVIYGMGLLVGGMLFAIAKGTGGGSSDDAST